MTGPRQILRNASRRPVEIHLADRIEVLLPNAMVECAAGELTQAGVAPLLTSGTLTRFEVAPPEPLRVAREQTKRAVPSTKGTKAACKQADDLSSRRAGKRKAAKVAPSAPLSAKSSTANADGPTTSSGDPT